LGFNKGHVVLITIDETAHPKEVAGCHHQVRQVVV